MNKNTFLYPYKNLTWFYYECMVNVCNIKCICSKTKNAPFVAHRYKTMVTVFLRCIMSSHKNIKDSVKMLLNIKW